MRVVIQRVADARVSVQGVVKSQISKGVLVLLGVEKNDIEEDADWLVKKISHLRIFGDDKGLMNNSLLDINGEVIVVSQFTLYAKTRKGNRPSYIAAANSKKALLLYNFFIQSLEHELGKEVQQGVFGADMQVNICNDGPVTIIIDTKNKE